MSVFSRVFSKRGVRGVRKRKGSIMDVLPSLLVVFVFVTFTLTYMYVEHSLSYKDFVDQTAREYLLKMETVGYLTPADASQLVSRLESNGVTGVRLDGTTLSPVHYGDTIVISIDCNVPVVRPNLSGGLFDVVFSKTMFPVHSGSESTAKH